MASEDKQPMHETPAGWRLVRYRNVRHEIRDADLLLFRRRRLPGSTAPRGIQDRCRPLRWIGGLLSLPITVAGRGPYSHAAKAAWWGDDLFCVEIRGLSGGRAVTLSSQVARLPGKIDVFETNPQDRWTDYNRARATRLMRRLCGCDYGYVALAAAALLHLPGVRWFVKPNVDDAAVDRRPPFCSHACAMADRLGGGVDPVRQLADRLTEPADLARSPFYRYRFTLVP
jgi:hypothetical protein